MNKTAQTSRADFVAKLALSTLSAGGFRLLKRGRAPAEDVKAAVDVGSVVSFVENVEGPAREDVLFSVELAQRAANSHSKRNKEPQAWYEKYLEVMEAVGWTREQLSFVKQDQSAGELRMDASALKIIGALATQNQLTAITASIKALEKMAESDGAITLFDYHGAGQSGGNFQIGSVEQGKTGALTMAMGAFYFRSRAGQRRFLFVRWGSDLLEFWAAATRVTLNRKIYAEVRDAVREKVLKDSHRFIAHLEI